MATRTLRRGAAPLAALLLPFVVAGCVGTAVGPNSVASNLYNVNRFVSHGTNGWIYEHTTVPVDLNVDETPVHPASDASEVKHFTFYVDVAWDSNGIADIARKHGLHEVYYADLETTSVLGIWTTREVHVYGR